MGLVSKDFPTKRVLCIQDNLVEDRDGIHTIKKGDWYNYLDDYLIDEYDYYNISTDEYIPFYYDNLDHKVIKMIIHRHPKEFFITHQEYVEQKVRELTDSLYPKI